MSLKKEVNMFSGSIVALVTPFKNGKVDTTKLKELVNWHCEMGTSGIVPCGTTGESPTLSHEEHHHVVEVVVKETNGRIPVIAGAGSNSTQETLQLTQHAKDVGADGVLLVNPYYNKPTQNGLIEHFKTVARKVDIPVVLYNIPGRSAVNMTPQTIATLAQEKNIVAIKEATGSLDQASAIRNLCDLAVLSGDDALTLPLMSIGGTGVISVAANIIPQDVARLVQSFADGQIADAQKRHNKLFSLCKALFLETNPIPIKAAMAMMGTIEEELRLPLTPLSKEYQPKLESALKEYGLI